MRHLPRVYPNEAAISNSTEKMGALSLPVDFVAIKYKGLFQRKRAKSIARDIRVEPSELLSVREGIIDKENGSSSLTDKFLAYGRSLVSLANSEEHYTRYRHYGGSLLDRKTQDLHRFLVVVRETANIADEIGLDTNHETVASQIIKSTNQLEQESGNFTRHEAAAAITALALAEMLANDPSYQMEVGT